MPLPDAVRRMAELEDQLRVRYNVAFVSDVLLPKIQYGILVLRLTYEEVLHTILESVDKPEAVLLQAPVAHQEIDEQSLISA